MLEVNTRVKVQIAKPETYAQGSADALNGKTGTVRAFTEKAEGRQYLVAFDTPAPRWWGSQTPPKAWWFPAEDLRPL